MASFQDTLFEFFGRYDKLIDSYKDVDGKGIEERFQGVIGQSIDDELMTLIDNFLPNTIEAQTAFERLLPLAERMLGYDTKNQTLQLGTTVDWHRRILAHMVKYYAIKGTLRSYELLFGIMGLTVEISETWPNQIFDSTDPDIGLDSDERPVLDLGPCEPCSPYTLTVTGGPDYADIQAGFESIVLFNEPINAQGSYTYNGQTIDVLGGPVGDPCPVPQATLEIYDDEETPDGDFNVNVYINADVDQPDGFTLGDVSYVVDGGDPVPVTWAGDPTSIGPFVLGQTVEVLIVNAERLECVKHLFAYTSIPCSVPTVTLVWVGSYVTVTMTDDDGGAFIPSDIRYSVNGLPSVIVPFDGSDPVNIGPFIEGDSIEVWVDDVAGTCPFNVGTTDYPMPFVCTGEGYGLLVVGPEGLQMFGFESSTGYISVRHSNGTVTTNYGELEEGSYCMFSSDEGGIASGFLTSYEPFGDLQEYSTDGFINITYAGLQGLPAPVIHDLSPNTALTFIQLASEYATSIPTLSALVNLNSLGIYSFPLAPNIPSIDALVLLEGLTIDGQTFTGLPSFMFNVLLSGVQITNCPNLTESTVADRLDEMIAFGDVTGQGRHVSIYGCGTPPTSWTTKGATLTSMGWTVSITA